MKLGNKLLTKTVILFLAALLTGCNSVQGIGDANKEVISTVDSTDGSAITYGVRGQGNVTIVFVHCWTCDHEFWKPQVEFFSSDHKVAWLDLAGHGLSNSHREEYTMSAFGEDVAAVVNDLGGHNVILVGHSMGGPVAIEAANLLGDKVIGIVGVDTFYTAFEYPKSEAKIDEFVKPFEDDFNGTSEQMVRSMFTPEADPELVASIVKKMSVADKEMGISAMHEIFRWSANNIPSSLNKYAKQLRNINGAPTGKETALHESVVLIPGVGHFVAQVKPNAFNQALSEILSEYQAYQSK